MLSLRVVHSGLGPAIARWTVVVVRLIVTTGIGPCVFVSTTVVRAASITGHSPPTAAATTPSTGVVL